MCGTWDDFTSLMCAPARLAMKYSVAGGMAWSFEVHRVPLAVEASRPISKETRTERVEELRLDRRGLAGVRECPIECTVGDFLPTFLRGHEVGAAG